jgi:hypothetical protein
MVLGEFQGKGAMALVSVQARVWFTRAASILLEH